MLRIFRIAAALITAEAVLLATTQASLPTPASSQQFSPPAAPVSSTAVQSAVKRTQPYSPDLMPMPLVAPLFIEDESTHSQMVMVNDSTKPLDIDIVVYAPSGDELAKKTISMAAHSQKMVKISTLLEESSSISATTYGSISVLPHRSASLAAQLSIISAD